MVVPPSPSIVTKYPENRDEQCERDGSATVLGGRRERHRLGAGIDADLPPDRKRRDGVRVPQSRPRTTGASGL